MGYWDIDWLSDLPKLLQEVFDKTGHKSPEFQSSALATTPSFLSNFYLNSYVVPICVGYVYLSPSLYPPGIRMVVFWGRLGWRNRFSILFWRSQGLWSSQYLPEVSCKLEANPSYCWQFCCSGMQLPKEVAITEGEETHQVALTNIMEGFEDKDQHIKSDHILNLWRKSTGMMCS